MLACELQQDSWIQNSSGSSGQCNSSGFEGKRVLCLTYTEKNFITLLPRFASPDRIDILIQACVNLIFHPLKACVNLIFHPLRSASCCVCV
jgi:hypothetical protein